MQGRCLMHIFESVPILCQSLKLRLQQLAKEYKADEELLAFVPFPTAGDYEPGHDNGYFGDAWLQLPETAKANGERLLASWRKFAENGEGVFDLYCEIRLNTDKVPKRKDKLTKAKAPPKKTSSKKLAAAAAMRDGYSPLRVSKDLPLDPHYPRAVKGAFNSICDKIQTITTARAKKKELEDIQERLKVAKEKLLADAKAKQEAEAAAAAEAEAAAAAAATTDPATAGVLCDLRSVCFFVFWPAFLLHLSYSNPLFLIYESYQHKQHLPHHHPSLKKNLLLPTLRWRPRFWRWRRRLTTRLRRLRSWCSRPRVGRQRRHRPS